MAIRLKLTREGSFKYKSVSDVGGLGPARIIDPFLKGVDGAFERYDRSRGNMNT